MPVPISYPPLTDPVVFLANLQAAQNFFNNFKVPDATAGTPGGVLKAANVAAPLPTTYVNITIIDQNGNPQVTQVVSAQAYNNLYNQVSLLLLQLKTAGIMVGD